MEQQRKVENALTDAIRQLDKGLLRKSKAEMFRCSAKCCDDPYLSIEESQTCTEQCAKKILRIEQLVQTNFQDFQERLDRSLRSCHDEVKDKMTSDTTELEAAKFQRQYDECVSNQVDANILKLPNLIKKLLVEGNKIQNS